MPSPSALLLIVLSLLLGGGALLLASRRRAVSALPPPLAPPSPSSPSSRLGRYQLRERIGRGGMSEVWAAIDTDSGASVALKVMRPHDDHERARRRFDREIRAMAELRHPSIVRILDFGSDDEGACYYAMELLEGQTLAQLVRAGGALAPARATALLRQCAEALAEAHRAGTLHRDLKPENTFVTRDDRAKIIDFGIARAIEGDASEALTEVGYVAGTPAYMSPETLAGEAVDARSDVYSLGATLYFALTGTPPFQGKNIEAIVTGQLHGVVEPPGARRGAPLPPGLEDLVLRCLEKRPEDRYPDADALALALAEQEQSLDQDPADSPSTVLRLVAPPDAPTSTSEVPVSRRGGPGLTNRALKAWSSG